MNQICKMPREKLSSYDEERLIKHIKNRLEMENKKNDHSGIYGKIQITLAYHSNKIEGSTLTLEQTASLFDTGTILADGEIFKAKDIEETTGHFSMFNEMLKTLHEPLSEDLIKKFHFRLKSGVFEDLANGYPVGEYKNRLNQVANIKTARPDEVSDRMKELLQNHDPEKKHTVEDLARFHAAYETIHPFQDGNGRTGRLLLLRECLASDIIPVIIQDENKLEYYHALNTAQTKKEYKELCQFFEKEQAKYYSVLKDFLYEYTKEPLSALDGMISDTKKELSLETRNHSESLSNTEPERS